MSAAVGAKHRHQRLIGFAAYGAASLYRANIDRGWISLIALRPRRGARPLSPAPHAALEAPAKLAAVPDEATAGSIPTTIERNSSSGIRVTALTQKRAPTATACNAGPHSSAPLHGLDEILNTLFFS